MRIIAQCLVLCKMLLRLVALLGMGLHTCAAKEGLLQTCICSSPSAAHFLSRGGATYGHTILSSTSTIFSMLCTAMNSFRLWKQ